MSSAWPMFARTAPRAAGALLLICSVACGQNAYLSTLSATHDSPLFTTYAAPPERSRYIVDQGYQFLWNDTSARAEFAGASWGGLCFAYRIGDGVRHAP